MHKNMQSTQLKQKGSGASMRQLTEHEINLVSGGELNCEIGTGGASCSGSVSDWMGAASAAYNFAADNLPLSAPAFMKYALDMDF